MTPKVQNELLKKIKDLELQIEEAIESSKEKFSYEIQRGKIVFDKEIQALQRKEIPFILSYLKNIPILFYLVAPVIYALIIPALIWDLSVTIYQWICFPVYKIPKVDRKEYIIFDRHHLKYLNIIEKIGCVYCSYVNGLLLYTSEVAGRTEQYFCPIKHTKRLKNTHAHYAKFLEYGEFSDYQKALKKLQADIQKVAQNDETPSQEGKSDITQ